MFILKCVGVFHGINSLKTPKLRRHFTDFVVIKINNDNTSIILMTEILAGFGLCYCRSQATWSQTTT
jgi:hypothetical protein